MRSGISFLTPVLSSLADFRATTGQLDYGGMPIARSGRTLELFIEKVLPQLS